MNKINDDRILGSRISVFLVLVLFGLDLEFINLYSLDYDVLEYMQLLFSFLPLLLYAVPLFLLFKTYSKKLDIKPIIIIISMIGGAFIVGWSAGLFNEIADELLMKIFGGLGFIDDWLDAIGAPIVEESLKLIVALMVLNITGKRDIKTALVVGAGVGLGFQIVEDISYIVNEEAMNGIFQQSLMRVSGSIASHWSMTAVLTVGYIYYKDRANYTSYNKRNAIDWILGPILVHFLWNSPLTTYFDFLILVLPVALTMILIKHLINIVNTIFFEENHLKEMSNSKENLSDEEVVDDTKIGEEI